MSEKNILIVMQGAPGSGKTSLARLFHRGHPKCIIHATDSYHFLRGDGWVFQPDKLEEYHRLNQERTETDLKMGWSVIVDNTNVRAWEARPYVEIALRLNVPVVFVRCEGRFPNTHGVPAEKVEVMRASLEPLTIEACLVAVRPSRGFLDGEGI